MPVNCRRHPTVFNRDEYHCCGILTWRRFSEDTYILYFVFNFVHFNFSTFNISLDVYIWLLLPQHHMQIYVTQWPYYKKGKKKFSMYQKVNGKQVWMTALGGEHGLSDRSSATQVLLRAAC